MPSNLGYEFDYNTGTGYIPMYPRTTASQVEGMDLFGNIYGYYQLTLSASGWADKQQVVQLEGVLPTDYLNCNKVLSGTTVQMLEQDEAYGLLDPYIGIESMTDEVKFTCTDEVPSIDLTVQVYWVR